MARSMDDLPDYLRARGFRVVGVPGWRKRGRPVWTGGYDPKGGVAHHTGGTDNGMRYAETVLAQGYRDLAGPLCQLALNRDGTVIFVAAKRANHAGKVRSIRWMRKGDGNAQALGIEAMNTGTEGWTVKRPQNPFGTQYAAYVRLCAAVSDYMGWPREQWLGHGECSTAGKWDPGIRDSQTGKTRMLDMNAFRAAIKDVRFTDEPAPTPPSKPTKRWFKLTLANHGGANVTAAKAPAKWAKWLTRRKAATQLVLDVRADVIVGLECGSGQVWDYLTSRYGDAGYALVPGGTGGRHLWVRPEVVQVKESGSIEPKTHHADGNDKPAPWLVGTADGSPVMIVGFHLEYRDPTSRIPMAQMREIISAARKIAAKHQIAEANIIFAGDTASDNYVRDKVVRVEGWADGFDVAKRAVNAELKSYNEYKPARPGPRVDIIAVYRGAGPGKGGNRARPVEVISQRPTTALDHHVMSAVINRQ